MWSLLAAVLALVGTVRQALTSLRDLSELDPEAPSAFALRDLQDAKPSWFHPLRRREHHRILQALKHESPAEARAYQRIYGAVLNWSFLAASSLLAGIASIAGLFHGSR